MKRLRNKSEIERAKAIFQGGNDGHTADLFICFLHNGLVFGALHLPSRKGLQSDRNRWGWGRHPNSCGISNCSRLLVEQIQRQYRCEFTNRHEYFSVDGGKTVAVDNAWSLGRNFGDGRQASHWKDSLGRGIMDPTFASGELGIVTNLDLRAFEVMGFNSTTVPEPTSMAIFFTGIATLGLARRKRPEST